MFNAARDLLDRGNGGGGGSACGTDGIFSTPPQITSSLKSETNIYLYLFLTVL